MHLERKEENRLVGSIKEISNLSFFDFEGKNEANMRKYLFILGIHMWIFIIFFMILFCVVEYETKKPDKLENTSLISLQWLWFFLNL